MKITHTAIVRSEQSMFTVVSLSTLYVSLCFATVFVTVTTDKQNNLNPAFAANALQDGSTPVIHNHYYPPALTTPAVQQTAGAQTSSTGQAPTTSVVKTSFAREFFIANPMLCIGCATGVLLGATVCVRSLLKRKQISNIITTQEKLIAGQEILNKTQNRCHETQRQQGLVLKSIQIKQAEHGQQMSIMQDEQRASATTTHASLGQLHAASSSQSQALRAQSTIIQQINSSVTELTTRVNDGFSALEQKRQKEQEEMAQLLKDAQNGNQQAMQDMGKQLISENEKTRSELVSMKEAHSATLGTLQATIASLHAQVQELTSHQKEAFEILHTIQQDTHTIAAAGRAVVTHITDTVPKHQSLLSLTLASTQTSSQQPVYQYNLHNPVD